MVGNPFVARKTFIFIIILLPMVSLSSHYHPFSWLFCLCCPLFPNYSKPASQPLSNQVLSAVNMANKFPSGPFELPDARALAAREMPVDVYFKKLQKALQANAGGNALPYARMLNLLKGAWSQYPTLDQLLDRLTPAQLANLNALQDAVRTTLYPQGDAQLQHNLLQKFWNRSQLSVEIPPGSSEYYPEPALSYTEDKRNLISQLPANQHPPEAQIISSMIFGLQPQLRQAVNVIRPKPQTIDEAVAIILEQEQSISEPAAPYVKTATSFTTTAHAVPGLTVHPPMSNPPLHLFGKLSAVTSAPQSAPTIHVASATPQVPVTPRDDMEQLKQDMNRRLDELQTSLHTTITSKMERTPHYGPGAEEHRPKCGQCDGNHPTSKCFGKCKHCGRFNHPNWRCYFRNGNRGGRGGGRGGFHHNGGRGSGNNSKRSADVLTDTDLQSLADQVAKRLKGEAQRARQADIIAQKARQALNLEDDE